MKSLSTFKEISMLKREKSRLLKEVKSSLKNDTVMTRGWVWLFNTEDKIMKLDNEIAMLSK